MRDMSFGYKILFAIALCLPTAGLSAALAADGSIVTNKEIIVTASRLEENVEDISASVSLIPRAEIVNSAARNVDDLLRLEGGIAVLQPTGMGYGLPSQINIRGVPGQSGTLLLVDGMPLNEASTGYVNINEVRLENIERIEIARGAFSAVHGADAFGGVVNIVTRNPHGLPTLSLSGGIGSEGYETGYVQHSHSAGNFGYTLGLGRRRIDNYLAQDEQRLSRWDPRAMRYVENISDTENYDYEDEHAALKVNAHLAENAGLTIYARRFESELGYGRKDVRPLYPRREDDTIENRSSLLGARFQAELSPQTCTFLKGYYREQEKDLYGLDIAGMQGQIPLYVRTRSETRTDDWRLDWGLRSSIGEKQTVLLGLDYLNNHYDFAPVRDNATGNPLPASSGASGDIGNLGLYIQDKIDIGEVLLINAGLRLDGNSDFDEAISPKLGARYSLGERTALRASLGRAYRAPSATELYQPAVLFGSVVFRSNPDLEPEYIVSTDAGIEHSFDRDGDLRGHLDIFYNDMKDLISKQFSGQTLSYDNVSDAWSRGIEAGLDLRLAAMVDSFANYTYQQSENENTGDDLEHIPEHMASAGIRLSHSKGYLESMLSVMETYVGERGYLDISSGQWRELDSYLRSDVSIDFIFNETVTVKASVQNAFDEEYQEWSLINPAAGRLFAFELGVRYW